VIDDRVRVLLIEDDEDDYVLVRELMREIDASAALEWKSSYAAGVAALLGGGYDVCLVDYHLGPATGVDLLRGALGQGCTTPIILLTGQDDRETDLEAMRAGASDYLVKGEITAALLERAIRYARERHRLLDKIRALSLVEELTGLYNRRGFFTLAEQQLKLGARLRRDALLLFIDLDGLKQINDRFGHLTGDRALIDTADLLRRTFRQTDVIARLGGDEFVVLAGNAGGDVAQILLDRLDANLAALNADAGREYPLRLSVGYLVCDPAGGTPLEEMLMRADQLMYQQKHTKRLRAPQLIGGAE
jgi:diguanylate cyclase (GGDEF)-like protein